MARETVEYTHGVLTAEEALQFLDEASGVLVGSLDYERTLGRIAQLAVPSLADWCAIDVVEDDGSLRQITSGHPDPDHEQLLTDLRARYRAETKGSEGVMRVVASGRPELRPDISGAPRVELLPEEVELYERLAPKSYMIVPLTARGRTLGALTLMSTQEGRHYGPTDLAFAAHLARRFSLAIDNARLYDAAERSRGLLDTLLRTAPVGLGFVDRDLRFVRANDALAESNGVPIAEHIGRTIGEVLGPMGEELTPLYRRVVETGEPVFGHELAGETPADPGSLHHFVASATPVLGHEEEVIGVGVVLIDVTDQRRALQAEREARRRASFLAEAGALLDESMDYDRTLANLARLAVPHFADWCTVHLVEEDGEVRQVAMAHADPGKLKRTLEIQERYPAEMRPDRGIGRVIATGAPEVIDEIPDEMLVVAAQDAEHLELLRELDLCASVIAPLQAAGRTVGALTFISSDRARRYGEADVELLVELGRRAGVAVENARLYTERSRIAHTLQARLLPATLPAPAGLRFAARYRAAGQYNEVGGDFYDAFERAPGEWVAVIGDVSGKGPEAAALTALARYTIRAAALNDRGPANVLHRLNDALLAEAESQFITVALAYLRPDGPETSVRLVLGGHPHPRVIRARRLGRGRRQGGHPPGHPQRHPAPRGRDHPGSGGAAAASTPTG